MGYALCIYAPLDFFFYFLFFWYSNRKTVRNYGIFHFNLNEIENEKSIKNASKHNIKSGSSN
jgi:hypothetical protein